MSNVRKWELFIVVLVAGAVGYVWYGKDAPPAEPPVVALPPMPAVEDQAVAPEIPGFRGLPPMGYRPNPEGTDEFLKSMEKPTIREAGPELFRAPPQPDGRTSLYQAPQEGAYPYRALFKAHQQIYGEPWVCGTQGIGDCFMKNTQVTMADGTCKNIQDVVVGDMVCSHKGTPRKVVDVFQKQYSGELITIVAKGFDVPITATADHRFVTYPGIKHGRGSGNHKPNTTPEWKAIGDLTTSDRVLLTKINPELTSSITSTDFGWLFGLFLAEGSLDKYPNGKANRITLSLGRHETDLVERSSALFRSLFGIEPRVDNLPSKPSVTLVRCGNVEVAQLFQSLCSGNVYEKKIPAEVFTAIPEVRMSVIQGWIAGDGNERINKSGKGYSFQVQGVSASPELLQDMHRLALSCEVKTSLRMRDKRADRADSGDLFIYGQDALNVCPEWKERIESVQIARGPQSKRSKVEHGEAAPVKSIERRTVENETVYCITVEEDHSFVANGYGVHNCVSWGWHHGVAIASAVEFMQGNTSEWKLPATEAIYGGARVEGSGHPGDGAKPYGGYSDGSYGGVAAKWVHTQGGILYREKYERFDLSKYSPKVAKEWGAFGCGGKGDSGFADALAKKHPCKRVALVSTFEEAAAAIRSGYPVPVCSNQGFRSVRDADGFAAASGSWAHCMCFIAVRYDKPGLLCLNSWGPDWIKGPKFPEDQPDGSFWVSVNTCNRMLAGKDSFAVSAVDGFPFRPLDNADWVYNRPTEGRFDTPQYVLTP